MGKVLIYCDILQIFEGITSALKDHINQSHKKVKLKKCLYVC